jgi:biopolymer transport protein ExbD
MIKDGVLTTTAGSSPLLSASTLNPKGGGKKRDLVATVILTSLVDAFSILVIYLLVSSSNSGEMLYLSKDMQLPKAAETEILKRNTLVKIEEDRLFIEEEEVAKKDLVARLIEIRKNLKQKHEGPEEFVGKLTVQADRRLKYKVLNQIVLASSHAGFSEVKFAVLAQ